MAGRVPFHPFEMMRALSDGVAGTIDRVRVLVEG